MTCVRGPIFEVSNEVAGFLGNELYFALCCSIIGVCCVYFLSDLSWACNLQ